MEEDVENEKEQIDNRPWLYKKGQSGNPKGRPPGTKTLKGYIKERFSQMTDEEREDFLAGLDKKTIWEMGEGKPKQDTDITSNGESINPILVKFIDGETKDN